MEKANSILFLFSRCILIPIFTICAIVSFFHPEWFGDLQAILQKGFWLLDLEKDEEKFYPNNRSPKFVRYKLEFLLEQDLGWIEENFNNNYVDVMVTPQWSLKFPFSQFSDSISGYRKINPIILTDGETTEEGEAVAEAGDGEINLMTLINDHINNLAYSDKVKENLMKVSQKFYYDAIKEMEEKRNEN